MTIQSAINTYYHEYGSWPCPSEDGGTRVYKNDNNVVINYLTADADDGDKNLRGVHFLSISDYRFDADKNVLDPSGSKYKITINIDEGKVSVE